MQRWEAHDPFADIDADVSTPFLTGRRGKGSLLRVTPAGVLDSHAVLATPAEDEDPSPEESTERPTSRTMMSESVRGAPAASWPSCRPPHPR